MAAQRHKLRLYRGWSRRLTVEDVLDPRDPDRLRELFLALVEQATRSRNPDYRHWRLDVVDISGGPIRAKVSIDRAGRTVIRR